jgi:hypothetical protein
MQLSHRCMAGSAVFDEPNLVSSAGLVPVFVLAESAHTRTRNAPAARPEPRHALNPKQPSARDQDQLGTGYRWIRA